MAGKLSASQRGKIRKQIASLQKKAINDEVEEFNDVPFLDVITNLLIFSITSMAVVFTSTIETSPPKLGGGSGSPPPSGPSLNLTVTLVPDGFSIKARGGNIAPGCNDTGAGLAVPKATNAKGELDYDYKSIKECVKKLKNLSPEFKEETQATVSANPEIPYQAIVSTLDAIRKDEQTGEDLFPEVNFGVGR